MANFSQKYTAANIRYLLVLGELGAHGEGVRTVDISKQLGVSKPSVHKMLTQLRELELIQKNDYSVAYLTGEGQRLAAYYLDCYSVLYQAFRGLLHTDQGVRGVVCSLLAELPAEEREEICRRLRAAETNGDPIAIS